MAEYRKIPTVIRYLSLSDASHRTDVPIEYLKDLIYQGKVTTWIDGKSIKRAWIESPVSLFTGTGELVERHVKPFESIEKLEKELTSKKSTVTKLSKRERLIQGISYFSLDKEKERLRKIRRRESLISFNEIFPDTRIFAGADIAQAVGMYANSTSSGSL